jgi:hypothetical protein
MPSQAPLEDDELIRPQGTAVIRRSTGPAREQALQSALDRFASGRLVDRPDSPDGWVTAVRHIPAQDAVYAEWPTGVDALHRAALEARGFAQLSSHQAGAV